MRNRDMYNSSGCLDMTAFLAIRNVEHRERIQRKQYQAATKQPASVATSDKAGT